MTAVKFSDLVGDYKISAENFVRFVKVWYQPEDWVAMPRRKEESGRFVTVTQKAREIIDSTDEDLERLIFEEGKARDFYFNVCPMTEQIVSETSRGTEKQVARMPGVWIDLDVKEGSFQSKEEILSFLAELPEATLVVDSGNGVHAYWRFTEVDVSPDKQLTEAFQAWVREQAGGYSVDSTADLARCLRAPGTVHTGKGTGKMSSVKLLKTSSRAYRVSDVRELVKDSLERQRAARAVARERESVLTSHMDFTASNGPFGYLMLKANYEELVNEHFDWATILEHAGWTLNRTLGDGSREWTRPGSGASSRSATTDHEGSNVMSLLSESEGTGLADLKGMANLSKSRVMLKLWFSDDPEGMFDYLYKTLYNVTTN